MNPLFDFCWQELIPSQWFVLFLNKDFVQRGTNANSHTIFLWREKERREVFMLIPGMSKVLTVFF